MLRNLSLSSMHFSVNAAEVVNVIRSIKSIDTFVPRWPCCTKWNGLVRGLSILSMTNCQLLSDWDFYKINWSSKGQFTKFKIYFFKSQDHIWVRNRVPTQTGKPGKMGKYFPVREKSGNFEQTGKVRENHTKYWKTHRNSDKCLLFSMICKLTVYYFAKMHQVFS